MHRFFVAPGAVTGGSVHLTGPQAHQVSSVLRLRTGDTIAVLDDTGFETEVELTAVTNERVEGRVVRRSLVKAEPRTKVTLFPSLLKGERFELVLQKATELGVAAIVPVLSERCVVSHLDDASAKFNRWRRIVLEAAEQSGRGKLPPVHPVELFDNAVKKATGLALLPWEGERRTDLRATLREPFGVGGAGRPFSVALFVGPEGGYSEGEVKHARAANVQVVTLGSRVLRAETAAIAALTVVLYEAGELAASEPPRRRGPGREQR
ncbi:MAG: 16S rRNA (uracil(1498)-N(3))-methyltransferase [Chloroflexi bacterium]|nr:16S rRNA (uracil(1498)-N(3))-methyltransferase [Chloroflexota bacterium]